MNAGFVYRLLHIPEPMVAIGIPFLQLRAVSIFFMFLFFALIGFLRGVKNTRAVMYFYVIGAVIFVFFDYVLIFGKLGFPELGFYGSAIASIIQYVIMFGAACLYIIYHAAYQQYGIAFRLPDVKIMRSIFSLSWPVMIDKAALQAERVWLTRLIAPMGSYALGSFCVIKDLELFAFSPVVAFGQIVTMLVSNDFGARNFQAIKKNTIAITIMASIMVFSILALFMFHVETLMGKTFSHQ